MKQLLPIILALTVMALAPAQAAFYKVTSTADNVDAVITAGHAGTQADPYLAPSLRSAIVFANTAVANTIIFDASLNGNPITLSRVGLDNGGLTGDLDVTSPFTIQGNGPGNTIIQGGSSLGAGIDKIFSFNPMGTLNGFAVTISGVTLRYGRNASNNNATDGEGGAFDFHAGPNHAGSLVVSNCVINGNSTINGDGGAIALFDGGAITIANCAITNNTANSQGASVQGGAIFVGCATLNSTLTISGCTISGNTVTAAAADGGAIFLSGACSGSPTLTYAIHHCTISGNHSSTDGGGIRSAAPLTIDSSGGATVISGNSCGRNGGGLWLNAPSTLANLTITGNSASGNGGALHSDSAVGTLSMTYCRIVGNTAPSGSALTAVGGAVTAQNNWWGVNTTPAALISGTVNFTPWLMLRHSANPSTVIMNSSTTLTATFLTNSASTFIPVSNLGTIVGLPILFGNPVRGSLSGAQSTIQSSGTATATFTAGTSAGSGSADATVDGATATASISVTCPTVTGVVSGGGTVCAGGSANVIVTVTGGAPPYQVTLNNSGGTKSGASPFTFTLSPTGTTTYSLTSGTDNNGCPISGSGNATITVNAVPSTPTFTFTPPAICPGTTGNQASGPAGLASYAWSITNGTITSATSLQTITYTAGAAGNVSFGLVVMNASGCSATGSTSLAISPLPSPPNITATPASPCADSIGNTAVATAGYASYAWTITNGIITSATNLQTINYTAGSVGNVLLSVVVKNASGCSASSSTNLVINPAPHPATITATPPCANSVGNTASTTAGVVTYAWTITNGVITSATNLQTITYTAGASGNVGLTLVEQNPSGCTGAIFTNLPIGPLPGAPLIVTSPTNVCAGSAGNLASGPAGLASYAWSITNGTITSGTNLQTIVYTAGGPGNVALGLVVKNASGCSAASSTNVPVGPVLDPPPITATPASPCPNSTGNQASAPSGFSSYSWSITNGIITSATNLQAITYTAGASGNVNLRLIVSSSADCSVSAYKDVPILLDTIPPTITCSTNITVTASGNCPAPVSFTISATDNCSLLSLQAVPPSGSAFPVGTNTVNVTAADAAGNTNTCTFKVIVLAGPAPQLNIVRVGANAILSWSNTFGCYTLQSTPRFAAPPATNVWTAYAGPLITNAGRIFATNSISVSNRYYRLAF